MCTFSKPRFPNLRRYAGALTRDAWRVGDLVRSCLVRAIAKQHQWQPGTDLRAWLFTILHNQYVDDVWSSVSEAVTVPIENTAPPLTVEPTVEASLQLRDLNRALGRLPDEQRRVLLLIGLEGMRFEEAAAILGIPLRTVRSRVSRGRETLRVLLDMREERSLRDLRQASPQCQRLHDKKQNRTDDEKEALLDFRVSCRRACAGLAAIPVSAQSS